MTLKKLTGSLFLLFSISTLADDHNSLVLSGYVFSNFSISQNFNYNKIKEVSTLYLDLIQNNKNKLKVSLVNSKGVKLSPLKQDKNVFRRSESLYFSFRKAHKGEKFKLIVSSN